MKNIMPKIKPFDVAILGIAVCFLIVLGIYETSKNSPAATSDWHSDISAPSNDPEELELKEKLKDDPDNVSLLNQLGNVYFKHGKYDDAQTTKIATRSEY
jgi:cytochrome c-type biogenesis protein CcmH/NrfG